MHIYDYIIIGSGLTGLTIAKKISQETKNILVLEAQDVVGGTNRPVNFSGELISSGFRFFPGSTAAKKSIEFVEALLGQSVALEQVENIIETYEASGFKKFVGFGDAPPEFYEQLSYFLSQDEMLLSVPPHEWVHLLAQGLGDLIQTKSIITRFGFEGLDGEKPALTHVVVNGTKQLHARNFIFAGAVKELCLLLPDEIFNLRNKGKLKKCLAWQSVGLDLFHSKSFDKRNLFLLDGTTDDELGPCVGRFHGQVSQWTGFIDSEAAEDTENIGLILKKMKRQIKRAFPEMSEAVVKERICVSPALSGADIKLNADASLPKVENLWIASAQASPFQNLMGALMQAQLVLSALGFMPTANVSETPSETIDLL